MSSNNPFDPLGVGAMSMEVWRAMMATPGKLLEAQIELANSFAGVAARDGAAAANAEAPAGEPVIAPEPGDRRFTNPAWTANPYFDALKQGYLLATKAVLDSIDQAEGIDDTTRRRVKFFAKQFCDAMSPTNVPWFNPEVLEETMRTGGANFRRGLENIAADQRANAGRPALVDEAAFSVGKNVATTAGKVVFRNELIELIQYAPTQPQVYARPLVIVPPWINKFYILDLQAANSFVKYATDEGRNTFVVSWRNPDAALAHLTWADYMRLGPLTAMRVAAEIAGSKNVDAIGYCIGGTLLATALAYLARKKNKLVNSATFFAALVDFTDPGELMSFLSNEALAFIEEQMNEQGVLSGRAMADTFNMLRANDLIWGVAVNRYLLGKDAPAFDLLYWNSDATRIPRATHSYYLREMYVANNLSKPDALEADGVPIDLRRVKVDHVLRRHARRSHRAVALGVRDDAAVRGRDHVPAGRVRAHRRHHQPAGQEKGVVVGPAAGHAQPARARRVVRRCAQARRLVVARLDRVARAALAGQSRRAGRDGQRDISAARGRARDLRPGTLSRAGKLTRISQRSKPTAIFSHRRRFMHSSRSRTPVALLAAVLLTVAAPVAARANGAADAASAGVGVARISLIQGAVAVQRGDSATPVAAAINAPVLGADYVTTGDGARAEIQFDGSSSVRLGADVQMRFTHLDAADRELQLAAGTIDVRLLRGTDGRSQIDTPSVSIRPRATGSYRVSVDAAGRTQVTVRSGSADVVTPQGAQALVAGTTLLAQGSAANPSISSTEAIAYDDFDRFNRERDDREDRALARADYTAPGVAGIDDLDAYGRWVTDGGYGRVWVPSAVASSWAPYRDGRWVWEEGYGWTWLGYEPWGWAPYHYGRWYHSSLYGWCWYPERSFVVWRPAIVAFVNFGSGFGFGFGDIGWVPLAPFETFTPWWGNGFTNVTYVTNNYYVINNDNRHHHHDRDRDHVRSFGNARYNGVTYVAHQNFVDGRFEHLRGADPSKLRSIHPVRGIVPAVPTDANLRFSDRPVPSQLATVSAALTGGTFAGNTIAVRRTPFTQQREALASAAHVRTVAAPQPPAVQQPAAAQRIPVTYGTTTTSVPVTATREANDPWARFGASRGTPVSHTATSANAVTSATTTTSPRNAPDAGVWRHFDQTRPAGARDATAVREPAVTRSADTRSADTRRATSVQEPPRTYSAPRETREYSAPRPAQQAPPAQPAQVEHRSAPPPARTEHPPATKSTTPH